MINFRYHCFRDRYTHAIHCSKRIWQENTHLVVGVLGLLVVEAGGLLVIAGLRVQSCGLLAVKSIELRKNIKLIRSNGRLLKFRLIDMCTDAESCTQAHRDKWPYKRKLNTNKRR